MQIGVRPYTWRPCFAQASRPGGFKNHPDDPTNSNEVRERHLNKIKR
jgi:hypothetical protein